MDETTTVTDDGVRGAVEVLGPETSGPSPAAASADAAPADAAALSRSIEAILITCDRPVSPRRLAEGLGLIAPAQPTAGSAAEATDAASALASAAAEAGASRPKRRKGGDEAAAVLSRIGAAVGELNEAYARTGRTFRIELVAGGYRLMTLPALAPVLATFHGARAQSRLSKPAVETLAIIAYKQPITRAHLEAIRGVACGEVLRSLLDRRLIEMVGRAEEVGRPMLYGTTRQFLDAFGLASLRDLPTVGDLQGLGV